MRDLIRRLAPAFLIEKFRAFKKQQTNKALHAQKEAGLSLNENELTEQLKAIGISKGESVLLHCAMSKMGHLENGPQTVINGFLNAVGEEGNLLMPTSPVSKLQYDFIQENPKFNVLQTVSKMGIVSETFRQMSGVKRSAHPTEPVSAFGPLASYFTQDHFGENTPYTKNSPWYRLMEKNGKILYVGVTLINAGTNLHVLEDLTSFKYPVYHENEFEVEVTLENGEKQKMRTKVHNPEFSKRRRCDELIPHFIADNVLKEVKLGKAHCLLLDAKGMLDSMLKRYEQNGTTMYTPNGEKIEGYE
jgi:aminoglycoside 3-N-acetyltransferase